MKHWSEEYPHIQEMHEHYQRTKPEIIEIDHAATNGDRDGKTLKARSYRSALAYSKKLNINDVVDGTRTLYSTSRKISQKALEYFASLEEDVPVEKKTKGPLERKIEERLEKLKKIAKELKKQQKTKDLPSMNQPNIHVEDTGKGRRLMRAIDIACALPPQAMR